MQGKDVSEQAAEAQVSAGVDVGKAWLDAHLLPLGESLRVANDSQGIRQLKRWLLRREVRLVVVEATGKWHRELHRSLAADAVPVAVLDPVRARAFARATGLIAKTDRLDARMLASFAFLLRPPPTQPAPRVLEEIAELVVAREGAVAEQTALKNRIADTRTAFLLDQLRRRLTEIAAHIDALAAEILRRIDADPVLARRYEILTSIPGFGAVLASTLIVRLPELGACSQKQIAALAGLAPVADESGARTGRRSVRGGRPDVRRAGFLAALSAVRHNPDIKAFHQRLLANAKPSKLALIAAARKLIALANSLIANDRTWTPTAQN